ncbi:SCAF8 [Cordylochernes scorpioides]|uniref:SCAF8 n=1 Tax=Cordylochernes scorpioides TaxID=51811 RepID=A0ABY6K6I8_9ARAC|nr:SCAF8 [Cordylochernes scorpioides]
MIHIVWWQCRPEYKVPGLYVVDSIVRQSRHQFGADRDVFAPRFARNINVTFQHLFKCPEEERPPFYKLTFQNVTFHGGGVQPKIVRVLNLWQKNQVFPIELIQPLLNMAVPTPQQSSQPGRTFQPVPACLPAACGDCVVMTHSPPEPPKSYQDTSWGSWGPETASNHGNAACTTPSASIDPQILLQIQQHLQAAAAVNSVDSSTPNADAVKFDKVS